MEEEIQIGDINSLVSYLNSFIDKDISKPPVVPSPLILLGGAGKTGLSARDITKDIITKSQSFGIPIGALPDGSDSIWEKQMFNIVETIVEHFIKNAKFTVVIPPGTPVITTGFSATGAPVVSQGSTTNFTTGYAIVQ